MHTSGAPSVTTAAPAPYPIGTPGVPWGAAERELWLSRQVKHRSYNDDVARAVERLSGRFDIEVYGQLDYSPDQYRLFAVRSRSWRDDLPLAYLCGLGTIETTRSNSSLN